MVLFISIGKAYTTIFNKILSSDSDEGFIRLLFLSVFPAIFCWCLIFSYYSLPTYSVGSNGAICNDGWRSSSKGQGTCSHHGGVDHYTSPSTHRKYNGIINMVKDMPKNIKNDGIGLLLIRGGITLLLGFISGIMSILLLLVVVVFLISFLVGLPDLMSRAVIAIDRYYKREHEEYMRTEIESKKHDNTNLHNQSNTGLDNKRVASQLEPDIKTKFCCDTDGSIVDFEIQGDQAFINGIRLVYLGSKKFVYNDDFKRIEITLDKDKKGLSYAEWGRTSENEWEIKKDAWYDHVE